MPDVGNGKELRKEVETEDDEKKERHKAEEDDANEEEEGDDDDKVTAVVAVPPDGGWGWVVVFASFFCNALVDGLVFSFGAFLTQIPESLNESKAAVSLIGSLLSGFYLIAGPVASALANRYGFRSITIAGSAIACAAFAVSSNSNSVAALCFWYGLVGGLGFGLIYVPAVISVGFYFERWRALATGIAMCGSGIGTFVLAPITTYLLQQIGWRGTMLIQAGLVLNCAIFGLLFRPLKPKRVMAAIAETTSLSAVRNDLEGGDLDLDGTPHVPLLMRIKMARELRARQRNDSVTSSCYEHELFVADANAANNKMLLAANNSFYPTIKQVLDGSYDSLHLSHGNLKLHPRLDAVLSSQTTAPPIYPESITITGDLRKPHLNQDDEDRKRSMTLNTEALLAGNNMFKVAVTKQLSGRPRVYSESRRSSSLGHGVTRSRTMSNSSSVHSGGCDPNRGRNKNLLDAAIGSRPLYRDDIFYAGSVNKLPQYNSQISGLEYTLSVTRLPTLNDVNEEAEKACAICPEAVRRALATLLDTSVLLSPTFLLLAVSSFITMMGFFVPFMFITDRAMNLGGMEPGLAILLVSAIGVANTIGRVLCGLVTTLPGVSALLINNVALTIGGLATILSGYSFGTAYQFSYAVVFGLAISCFASLRSILIVELIGLEKLTNAFGLLLLFQGLAAAVGAPLAGLLTDVMGSYNASFYFSGTLILVSGIMCYPLNRLNAWEKQKRPLHSPKVV